MASSSASASKTPSIWHCTKVQTMKSSRNLLAAGALALAAFNPNAVHAVEPVTVLNETFTDFNSLNNWSVLNFSEPAGQSWFKGNPSNFAAQSGAGDSYAASSFLSALNGVGAIDNWLVTPTLSLIGPSTLSFYARGENIAGFNDTMEVLFSSLDDPTNFTVLTTVGGVDTFPNAWQRFNATIDHQGQGRFAFRHIGDAAASNYIGIDTVLVTTVPEPSVYLMLLAGLGGFAWLRRRAAH